MPAFTDKLEAIKHILSLGEGSEITIEAIIPEPAVPSPNVSADEPVVTEGTVRFNSFSIQTPISEGDENILYVESFGSVPNACGTGFVQLHGRKIALNMCEMEGKTTVYLPTVIGGESNYSTPFTVMHASDENSAGTVILVNNSRK